MKAKLIKTENGYGLEGVEIKNEIDKIVAEVVKEIKELATDISSEEQIKQVATISGNNDPEVGNLISEAIDKVGRDGVVTIEESKSGETTLEIVEGMQFDRGYKSPYFVTNNATMQQMQDELFSLRGKVQSLERKLSHQSNYLTTLHQQLSYSKRRSS